MERRGSDKISRLHTCLIIGSFALLAVNVILSFYTKMFLGETHQVEVSWMLYALVAGLLLSANLYKVPSFLKWFDRK